MLGTSCGAIINNNGYGSAFSDFDHDGDLDMILVGHSSNVGSINLLRNDSEARNWVMFELQQNQNNFYAVGATVELFSGNEKQINYIAAGNGYCSQNTFDIHFGLDTINYIDSVKIIWPDNQDEVFYDINVNNKNILKSTLKAMSIATNIAYNKYKFNKIYIDGPYYNPYIPPGEDTEFIPYECINKGDSTYTCIAAASILAKEQHNENIIKLVNDNPELEKYDLINNHGYGTKKHLDAINKYGVTKWHRKSYKCCK